MPEVYYSKLNSAKQLPLSGIEASTLRLQSHALTSELYWQVLTEGAVIPLLFVHQLTFGLRRWSVNQWSMTT